MPFHLLGLEGAFFIVKLNIFVANISAEQLFPKPYFSIKPKLVDETLFHIYLCFGQSNMEGQGIIEAQDLEVSERLQVLQSIDCDADRKTGNWRRAVPPLGKCDNGLGPADYFGRTMVAENDETIRVGLINVAVGGCDIRLFDKDIHEQYHDT